MKNHSCRSLNISPGGVREMVALALPMVVSHSCDTVMTFTDRLFLSRLGPDMMNASMLGGLTAFMMMTFFLGLIGYSTALVAQYLGAGQPSRCAKVTTQALLIAVAAYPLILACRPLAHQLFVFMGISSGQLAAQKVYFDILLYAAIIGLGRGALSGFFSGIGRTRIVMAASLTAMAVNVVGNYVLVFGKFGCPAFGIRGAAYGTIIGGASGLLILVAAYLNKRNREEYHLGQAFHFDSGLMRQLLRLGMPTGCEMFLNLLAFDAIVMIFHAVGPVAATASTIMFNWDMVSFVPLIGVEIGVTSLVGRYMGGRQPQIAHRAAISGLKLGLAFSAGILVLFIGFPAALVDLFHSGGNNALFIQAKPLAIFMLRAASLYVLIEAVFVVFIGALRGAGDTFWAMGLSVSLHWVLAPVLFLMLRIWKMPVETGWLTVVFLFMLFSIFVYLRYQSGHWKKIQVVPIQAPGMARVIDDFHETTDL
ncbi:MAG: MATE family efflux transporter [Candidatus Omnitrophica bacterium]|nr:MATE family efflux transporter [Candidatus Omnitrophota bacterium]